MPQKCFVFDLDGTLFNTNHRQHLVRHEDQNFAAFEDACDQDPPHEHVVRVALALQGAGYKLFYASGRSERVRGKSEWKLMDLGLEGPLYMRLIGDNRPDELVKADILTLIRANGFEPLMVFDDRDKVVAMWRSHGVPCAQVAPGNF